LRNGKKI